MVIGDENYRKEVGNQLGTFVHQLLGYRLMYRVPDKKSSTPLLLDPSARYPYFDEKRGINVAQPGHVFYGDKLDDPRVQGELFDRIYEDSEMLKDVELPTSRIRGFHNLSRLGQLYVAYKLATERGIYPELGGPTPLSRFYIEDEDRKWLSRLLVDEGVEWVANFKINGKDYVLPLTIEEKDVAHAASYAAGLFYNNGGFKAHVNQKFPKAVGMIYYRWKKDAERSCGDPDKLIRAHSNQILELANKGHKHSKALRVSILEDVRNWGSELDYCDGLPPDMNWVSVELEADPGDSMGATVVSTMTEAIAPYIQNLLKADVYVGCIVSNCFGRLVEVEGRVKIKDLARKSKATDKEWSGEEVAERMAYLSEWSHPYRRATETKGILNGICALGNVMRQDTRAIAAAVYNPATVADSRDLRKPLPRFHGSQWKIDGDELRGRLKVVIPAGTVYKEAREARMYYKLLSIENADQLAEIMGSVGLATNLSALSMLATIGVTEGRGKKNGTGDG